MTIQSDYQASLISMMFKLLTVLLDMKIIKSIQHFFSIMFHYIQQHYSGYCNTITNQNEKNLYGLLSMKLTGAGGIEGRGHGWVLVQVVAAL